MLVANVEEDDDENSSDAADGEVYVDCNQSALSMYPRSSARPTTPPPRNKRCKYTTQYRSHPTSYRPYPFREAHDETSHPNIPCQSCPSTYDHRTHLKLNRSLMHTCTKRINPPPAAPWNALPAISATIVFAVAHTTELAKKIAIAARIIGFRPHISDSFAQMGPDEALASRYAAPIHV